MEESKLNESTAIESNDDDSEDSNTIIKVRKKRKRDEDTSSEDIILPDNCFEVERNLEAAALKNNLSEKSVKHIIKKVVTNDHVLALVHLQEEEQAALEHDAKRPKLTRSKYKELLKSSPHPNPAWNIELSPINQIPVKTRPEVTALIAQELPDESDEEYQPTHDDVSDDDLDSQPKTPATPSSTTQSPQVVTDGPFKVPQEINTPVRRKLELDEPTIALRTRSKLSLSETPIEHIESSFVPPDELPYADVDDLWSQFLSECLDPAQTSKTEEDDEADPEYNADNDPDAKDEDEEALESNLVKISKKELSDLVTELFHVLPEGSIEELAQKDINNSTDFPSLFGKGQSMEENGKANNCSVFLDERWEGKKEIIEENTSVININSDIRVSLGKKEIENSEQIDEDENRLLIGENEMSTDDENVEVPKPKSVERKGKVMKHKKGKFHLRYKDSNMAPLLRDPFFKDVNNYIDMDAMPAQLPTDTNVILPEQIQILQQQLRQHVQICTSNFLQLYIHPVFWEYAPKYKEYLESLHNIVKKNPKSVVNVCNLEPAVELIYSWEATVSEDTPQNKEIVEHIERDCEKYAHKVSFGRCETTFHPTIMDVVASSSVFLYPYLLPATPFRPITYARNEYYQSEDAYIALGIKQFSEFMRDNPKMYPRTTTGKRLNISATLNLVRTHMMPWAPGRKLLAHAFHVRKSRNHTNPLYRFFVTGKVTPVKHKLLPFNPKMTLYQQPDHEMPHVWLKHLSKKKNLARNLISKRKLMNGIEPEGVTVTFSNKISNENLTKEPLPFNYLGRNTDHEGNPPQPTVIQTINTDKDTGKSIHNITITNEAEPKVQTNNPNCVYKYVETDKGALLMPVPVQKTVEPPKKPIKPVNKPPTKLSKSKHDINHIGDEYFGNHCTCCRFIRKICKEKQTCITDFYGNKKNERSVCPCKRKSYPNITNKLRLLIDGIQTKTQNIWRNFAVDIMSLKAECDEEQTLKNVTRIKSDYIDTTSPDYIKDLAIATRFQLKLLMKLACHMNKKLLKKCYLLFTNFTPNYDGPLEFMRHFKTMCQDGLLDIESEFIMFCTEAQAETLHKYREYFITVHLEEFVNKVKAEVSDSNKRLEILNHISNVLTERDASACYLCSTILPCLSEYKQLAQYFFTLFPHRHKDWKCPVQSIDITCDDISETEAEKETTEAQTLKTSIENMSNKNAELPDISEYVVPNVQIEIIDQTIPQNQSASLPYLETENTLANNVISTPANKLPEISLASNKKLNKNSQKSKLTDIKSSTPKSAKNVKPTNIKSSTPQRTKNVKPTNNKSSTLEVAKNIKLTNIKTSTPKLAKNIKPTNIAPKDPQNIKPTNIINIAPKEAQNIKPTNVLNIASKAAQNIKPTDIQNDDNLQTAPIQIIQETENKFPITQNDVGITNPLIINPTTNTHNTLVPIVLQNDIGNGQIQNSIGLVYIPSNIDLVNLQKSFTENYPVSNHIENNISCVIKQDINVDKPQTEVNKTKMEIDETEESNLEENQIKPNLLETNMFTNSSVKPIDEKQNNMEDQHIDANILETNMFTNSSVKPIDEIQNNIEEQHMDANLLETNMFTNSSVKPIEEVKQNNMKEQQINVNLLETNMLTNTSVKIENVSPDRDSGEQEPLIITKKDNTQKRNTRSSNKDPKEIKRLPSEDDNSNITIDNFMASPRSRGNKPTPEVEWSREEDKELLELLKGAFIKAKKAHKTIEDILKVRSYKVLKEKIPNKSISSIKARISYLTQLLMN